MSAHAPVAMRALPPLTWVPVAATAALLVGSLVEPAAVAAVAVPVALVGTALGIPHGAVDHLVPWWWGASAAPGRTRAMAGFTAAYAGVAALALAGFLLAPAPALVAFLVLSAVHFGRGEVVTSAERAGRSVPGPREDWLPAAAHGLVVVGLLLWASPADTDPLVRPLSPWLADAALASRAPGLLLVSAVTGLALRHLLRSGRRLEAAELALVAATFAVAPPLAAFGVWFAAWHSLRHTGRLLDLAGPDRGWGPAAARLARASALPSAGAFAAVAVLWGTRDLAGLQAQVAVLLALTFPHAAVVWALDQRARPDWGRGRPGRAVAAHPAGARRAR